MFELNEPNDNQQLTKNYERHIHIKWYIIHSNTYNCPILYFNAYLDSQPLGLDLLLKMDIIKCTNYISQTDNPVTQLPCYYIHPCNLNQTIKEVMENEIEGDYMKIWFMILNTLVYIQ